MFLQDSAECDFYNCISYALDPSYQASYPCLGRRLATAMEKSASYQAWIFTLHGHFWFIKYGIHATSMAKKIINSSTIACALKKST